jgi:radical SAM superfamily enzyme YgiQ (UPF0313 family)
MILIYPPAAKPSEPPAGIAKLAGVLKQHGKRCRLLDANIEGLLYLINCPQTPSDTWTKRAYRSLENNLTSIKDRKTYQNIDRYKRTVMDLNRVVEMSVREGEGGPGLANYQHKKLSPLRSMDLVRAAENPESNSFYPYFRKRFSELMEKEPSSVIGFSLNYLSQALTTFAMIGFLRKEYPGLTPVLGGGLVTSWMSQPDWENPFQGLVDHLIAGPGEESLLSILGIDNAKEDHARPDYDSLPIRDYLAPGFILSYSGSSGCFWNKCSFCPEKAESNPYLPVAVDRVVADLHALAKKKEPVLIHLLDNSMSPSLMMSLAENPPGVPWYGFARITHHLTDSDFCNALRRSGCVMLQLGLESGDQGVLDQMQKGLSLEMASLALKKLKQAGIATYIYLLFGTPLETLGEARKTTEFTVQHSDEIDFLNVALFNMPVGSEEAGALKTRGFYEGDLSLYTDFDHPEGWNRKQVREFLDNEFKKHPAISSILKRGAPIFTSNHAPFFVMDEDG